MNILEDDRDRERLLLRLSESADVCDIRPDRGTHGQGDRQAGRVRECVNAKMREFFGKTSALEGQRPR